MKCSFAKMSTKGTFTPVWPYGTDLYGRFVYLESGGEQVLIAAFDFNGSPPHECERWRREIARRTGIPAKSVWYHELQIHAAPSYEQMGGAAMDALIDKSADIVLDLIARAEECDCYVAECDLGTDFSFNREQYVEGLGGVTVWRGIRFDDDGTPYTNDPHIMLLRGYNPALPVFDQPIVFDNPNDQMAYLFRFVDKQGGTLGTISRFAAHPDVAVLFEHSQNPDRLNEYHYDYDWTGYLADDMAAVYGGVGMYINGPCADLATKKDCETTDTYEKSAAECKRLASLIGARMREIFEKKAVKMDSERLKTDNFEITLPMKEDIPHTYAEIRALWPQVEQAEQALKAAMADNTLTPAQMKKQIDDRWRIGHINHMCRGEENFGFTEQELASHEVTVHVTALRFGAYLFVGVPGESLVDMTLWLRSRFTGVKTVSVDQIGGYYNYMATPRSMTLGGYTYWASWVRRDAIPLFKKTLAPLLDEFLKD